ncbi:cutinase family protein [Pseudonocardia endophytica]|nr:cutinase family protein [Pseudonocardia endophytica]
MAGPGCPDVSIVTVPGSHQGAANGDSYGGGVEVDSVIGRVRKTITSKRPNISYSIHPTDYPAKLDIHYFESKNEGYNTTYEWLQNFRDCKNTKVIIAGFSQGAHIVGDLLNTIARTNSPIPQDKLLGGVLIADPGFNAGSPGATRIGFGFGEGVAGARPPFPSSMPVKSVCLRGDLVCDSYIQRLALAPPPARATVIGLQVFAELRNKDHESRYLYTDWPGTKSTISEYLGGWLSERVLATTK